MVVDDSQVVEERLAVRFWVCPVVGCSGRLAPWGWGRARRVFLDVEERGVAVVVVPRRARCSLCKATQVLIDERLLARRKDGLVVIQKALELAALGWGVKRIAEVVGRPFSTVRGWLRAARACAGFVEAGLAGAGQVVVGGLALVAAASVSPAGRLVAAGARYGLGAGWPVAGWLVAAASVCRGCLLQTSWWTQHELAVAGLLEVGGSLPRGP